MVIKAETVAICFQDLTEIAEAHKDILNQIEKIKQDTEKLQESIKLHYQGKSSEVLEELFTPLKQHIDFLHMCYEVTQSSARYIRNSMSEVDKALETSLMNSKIDIRQ